MTPRLFFQLAAGLIPVLLVTAAGARMLQPRQLLSSPGRHARLVEVGGMILAIGIIGFALVAELFTLELAFDPKPSITKANIVAGALVLLTGMVGVVLLTPWVKHVTRSWRTPTALVLLALLLGYYGFASWSLNRAVTKGIVAFEATQRSCLDRWVDQQTDADYEFVAKAERQQKVLIDRAFPEGKLTPKEKQAAADARADLTLLEAQITARLKDANRLLANPRAALVASGC